MKLFLSKLLLILSFIYESHTNIITEEIGNTDLNTRRKIIIDTDAGGDDAVGILLALKYELQEKDIEIVAITCTYGNTNVTNVQLNVQKILSIANRSDIPIYVGASKPLIKFWEPTFYFGQDGMNDFEFDNEITAKINTSKHASEAMIEFVNKHPGEVTIIALGPTTNLALAINLDPKFVENVGQFVVMGSTVSGRGSVSPGVDFNFGCDPESNAILMQSTLKPIIIVPREVSLNSPMYLDWRKEILASSKSSTIDFLNKAENINKGSKYWSSADPRTIAIALWQEDIVTEFKKLNMIPVREGKARGAVLVDFYIQNGKPFNAKTAMAMDVEKFKKKLIRYLTVD